ncbi:SgcJ/EcaC family oxidoreductase [Streptomyces sp. NPDC048479]|uniref:SgcJ/EcaC family oxidoreductase n=1 Tax=Streptomyces sp. NPDC048479 TaxID=3154725 RepID=UPI0034303AE6
MSTSDIQIQDLFQRFMQTWNDGDAVAFGACFTEDSDYVSYDGTRAVGRAEHQDNHDRLFRGVLTGSALVGEIEAIRYIAPGVAIVYGTASVLMPWRSELPKRRLSRQTVVVVNTDDGWRITAIHNGRVRPVTIPAPDSMPSKMSRTTTRAARLLGLGRRNTASAGAGASAGV